MSCLNETQLAQLVHLETKYKSIERKLLEQNYVLDAFWMIMTAVAAMTMQLGFVMLEVGTKEEKVLKSVLIKNFGDTMYGGVSWLVLGYSIASSDGVFFGVSVEKIFPTSAINYLPFIHSFAFSITSMTIVSGAIVGRVRASTYLMFAFLYNLFVYPPVALWGWGQNGFLNNIEFIDFAGGMIVHGLGGVSALVGAWMVGPRPGRFSP